MKPVTKLQKKIVALDRLHFPYPKEKALELVQPTADFKNWVETKIATYNGYYTKKGVVTCLECGHKFNKGTARVKIDCPHCKRTLKLKQARVRSEKESFYVSELSIVGDYQVVTNWLFCNNSFRVDSRDKYSYWMLNRIYINENLETHVMGVPWDYWGNPMYSNSVEYRTRVKAPGICAMYPKSKIRPFFRKRGIRPMLYNHDTNTIRVNPAHLIMGATSNSKIETIIKSKTMWRLGTLMVYGNKYSGGCCIDHDLENVWPSVKIAIRNNYNLKECQLWVDHINMLDSNKKDIRNSHYVCPKDLRKAHNDLIVLNVKREEKANKMLEEQRILKDKEARKKFYEEKSKFFDVKAKSGDIEIVTLKSIEEFQKESKALCHCLFHSGYYGRSNSLILSARVKGSITETIEYNLSVKEVAQCQGLQNSKSEHHDKILQVFNSKVVNQILKRIS